MFNKLITRNIFHRLQNVALIDFNFYLFSLPKVYKVVSKKNSSLVNICVFFLSCRDIKAKMGKYRRYTDPYAVYRILTTMRTLVLPASKDVAVGAVKFALSVQKSYVAEELLDKMLMDRFLKLNAKNGFIVGDFRIGKVSRYSVTSRIIVNNTYYSLRSLLKDHQIVIGTATNVIWLVRWFIVNNVHEFFTLAVRASTWIYQYCNFGSLYQLI